MLVMFVMSLLLLLLLLEGRGWLLLAMADPPIGRTAEDGILAAVAATKLLRPLKELLGCSIGFSGTSSRMSSSKLPRLLWGCAIARSVPVEWILWRIMLPILSIFLAWTCGKEERKSGSRWWKYICACSINRVINVSCIVFTCAPTPAPTSGGTRNSPVFKADR